MKKLQTFCFICSLIGHIDRQCEVRFRTLESNVVWAWHIPVSAKQKDDCGWVVNGWGRMLGGATERLRWWSPWWLMEDTLNPLVEKQWQRDIRADAALLVGALEVCSKELNRCGMGSGMVFCDCEGRVIAYRRAQRQGIREKGLRAWLLRFLISGFQFIRASELNSLSLSPLPRATAGSRKNL
ncbi:hypothetical protein L6452_23745 [Arctium lappa]|uniref:Uncharacterized protein n=1 Tax=Arctium lappa TaxID=4217 RepID=A0ACB9A9G3_ARCLA|nr:hypothetical protein L6452_23745 [Arctium lappa]